MWPCLTHALRPTRSLRSRSGKVVFWESCFCFSIFGDIKPNFGPFLENTTCFIPLGICFLNSLGNKTLFLPKLDSKWARNNFFLEIFSPLLDHFLKFLAYFRPISDKLLVCFSTIQAFFFFFRNSLGIKTSFRPIFAHFWNIFVTC